MAGAAGLRVHAVYSVLGELDLFRASLASVYDHVERIVVVTTHDRDWRGMRREPGGIVAEVLGRDLDPDRKIDLIVTSDTNEARTRNRAMDYAAPRRSSLRVRRQHHRDDPYRSPDYFLIVDADEIYTADDLERLKQYVAADRRPLYRVACRRYFKRWNYRIDGFEWAVSFVRADQRLPHLRSRKVVLPRRALARLPVMPASWRGTLRGFHDIPCEVGVFHHGSYVGPRARIAAKLDSSGHRDEIADRWMERVYDPWTIDATGFHPTKPETFASAQRLEAAQLPVEIAARAWPPEYLDA